MSLRSETRHFVCECSEELSVSGKMAEQTARRDLIRVCHLMYERSYVVSSDGNVSVRLDHGRMLAKPSMTCKGRMTEDQIAITDLEGRALNERKASSELAMHLLIYRERP